METLRVPTFKPGRYRVICHLTGKPKWVEYTAADVMSVVRNGNAQVRAGLSCPAAYMHDLDAKPRRHNPHEWIARGWYGQPTRWEYDRATGEAVAAVAVADPADAAQVAKVKWVSPWVIYDYVDQTGRKWPGASVLHIASTPSPVQLGLTPVSRDPAYRQTLLGRNPQGGVWLSYGTGVTRMVNDEVLAEGELPAGDVPAADADMDGVAEPAEQADDPMADLNDIVGLFGRFGVAVPEGEFGSMRELKEALMAAVDEAVAGKGTADMGEMGADRPGHAAAAMPPVLMSVAPSVPQIGDRIRALATSNRIPVRRRDEMLAQLNSAHLSIDPHRPYDGEFRSRGLTGLLADVEAYERLQPGPFSIRNVERRNGQAATLGVAPPASRGETAVSGGDEAFVEFLAKRNGVSVEEARRMAPKRTP